MNCTNLWGDEGRKGTSSNEAHLERFCRMVSVGTGKKSLEVRYNLVDKWYLLQLSVSIVLCRIKSRFVDFGRREVRTSTFAVCASAKLCKHNFRVCKWIDNIQKGNQVRFATTSSTMSLLRPSIAGRLLRVAGPTVGRVVPATVRYESGESSMVNHTDAKATQVRHNQPDYTAEVDQASSYGEYSI